MNKAKSISPQVAIIDIGMGNLTSVRNAVEYLGGNTQVINSPDQFGSCDRIILPGVGSFSEAITEVKEKWQTFLVHQIKENKKPFLGICLGMQLLTNKGTEGGDNPGLGLLDAETTKLKVKNLKLPHIGWNSVSYNHESRMFKKISDKSDFYFLHSYALKKIANAPLVGISSYGERFISAVELDNIWVTQFHPEKSQVVGLQLIRNFLEYSLGDD